MWARVVVLAGVLLACQKSATGPDRRIEQLHQLDQTQARWRSLGIHAYSFDYWMTCCWFRTHVRYVVRDDTVASAVALDSISPNPPAPITIDTVFARARAIVVAPDYTLRIVYDTSRWYPAVTGALSVVGFDGSWTDSVSDFVPLR